jgi:hypothetical protein
MFLGEISENNRAGLEMSRAVVGIAVDPEHLGTSTPSGYHQPPLQVSPLATVTVPVNEQKDYYELNTPQWIFFSLLTLGIAILCGTLTSSFYYVQYDEYGLLRDVYGTVRLSKVYELSIMK